MRHAVRIHGIAVALMMSVLAPAVMAEEGATSDDALYRPSYHACAEKADTTVAINSCIGEEYTFQDKLLNDRYKALSKRLDDSHRQALRDEERTWIVSRDKACKPDPNGGTAELINAGSCQLAWTAKRARELASRQEP